MTLCTRGLWAASSLFLLGLSACDKFDDPVIGIIEPCDATEVPEFEPLTSDIQRILVEDFTAHQCGNCPPAAIKAAAFASSYPDQIVPLAIHAGELASTNAEYPTDWTCEESDLYWNDLEFQVNPVGRINRLDTENSILLLDQWDAAVDALLGNNASAGLQMVVEYNQETGKTGIHVHVTWFAAMNGPVRLALLVAENHLVGPQLWYSTVDPPGPGFVEEYEHEHMLRGSVTGAKGLVVAENPAAGDTQQECYAFAWNNAWDAANCDLVAVLTGSDGHVIQTLSVPISE